MQTAGSYYKSPSAIVMRRYLLLLLLFALVHAQLDEYALRDLKLFVNGKEFIVKVSSCTEAASNLHLVDFYPGDSVSACSPWIQYKRWTVFRSLHSL